MFNDKQEEVGRPSILRKLFLSGGLTLMLLVLMVASLNIVQAREALSSAQPVAMALERSEDPVVMTGANFPAFNGVPLHELVLYSYQDGNWQAVPFQIDEVSVTGTYVISEDGLLDNNDELVFMANDVGDNASTAIWPDDVQARLHARYAITVSDPLNAGQPAWTYLYRSATLTRSQASYITWNYGTQTASALSYTASFSPTRFIGLSDLSINGRPADVLDRQKIRVELLSGLIKFNEEGLVSLTPPTITLPSVGPIRAATNVGDLRAAFYRSQIAFDVTFDLSGLGIVVPDFVRTSFDWNNPITSGLTTYYDSNTPGGVAIDGTPDVISTTPPVSWFQVNGGSTGPGGLVMAFPHVDPHGGTVTNYYKDNSALDTNDTGDRRSYADSGLKISGPFTNPAIISFTLKAYILPPGTHANVGTTYLARANNPLQTATMQQCATPSGACVANLVPPAQVVITGTTLARLDSPQTYVANVDPVTTSLPVTYVWQATENSPITLVNGLSASATFTWTSTGLKTLSVTVYNEAGAVNAAPLSVWVGRSVFLPLVLKNAP